MKLDCQFETENTEFKSTLSEINKGILSLTAMLNKSGGGKIYFGVSDTGEILGVEEELGKETLKKIGVRIAETVKPAIVPRIYFEEHGLKTIVVVEANGYNRPYSAAGEYRIRIGSENRKIDPDLLGELFFTNPTATASNVQASRQDLTFRELKQLYAASGLAVNDRTFADNMGLLTKDGQYNYLAEILSDANDCSIKVVRFRGKDKTEMVQRNEYGYRCLLIAMQEAFDYVVAFNEVRVDLGAGIKRSEMRLFDPECLKEAWSNACLHNRWTKNVPPAIYIFSDRIEVVSTGGLPPDFSKEEFFIGVSRPLNPSLQKIMGQLGLVEQTGHGVPKIVSVYGRDIFELGDNHITVRIPFAFEPAIAQTSYDGLSKSHSAVLRAIHDKPLCKLDDIAAEVGLSTSRVAQIISDLKKMEKLERIGSKKNGHWKTK